MTGIVVVTYKNTLGTISFINNQISKLKDSYKLVIVNNSSSDEDNKFIELNTNAEKVDSTKEINKRNNIFLIGTVENLGYAKGNNLGVKFLTKHFECEYFLFSNDDIEINDNYCLNKLINTFSINKDIGAVGPRIINLKGRDQSPHHKIITPYRQIGWKLFPFLKKKKKVLTEQIAPQSGFCYWVSGAFFMMRKSDFLDVKGFDPNTFLYFEEAIMAEKLKKINKRMYFENSVEIIHYEGGSSSKKDPSTKWNKFNLESSCYYYHKYLGYHKFIIWLYKFIITKL